MIVKQEAGKPQETAKVRLVQSMISSYFNSQKNDTHQCDVKPSILKLANKELPTSGKIQRARKTGVASTSKKRTTRKKQIESLSLLSKSVTSDDSPNKLYQPLDSVPTDTMKKAWNRLESQLFPPNTTDGMNPNDLKISIEADKTLSFENGFLTITVEDSDDEADDLQVQATQVNQEDLFGSSGKSPSKRTFDGICSPSKKIKNEETSDNFVKSNARKVLFPDEDGDRTENTTVRTTTDDDNDTTTRKSTLSPIFDEDTLDLEDYGVPMKELEAYSPSMFDSTRLNISTPSNKSQFVIKTENVEHSEEVQNSPSLNIIGPETEETIKKEMADDDKVDNIDQLNVETIKKEDKVDLDATVICDYTSASHSTYTQTLAVADLTQNCDSLVNASAVKVEGEKDENLEQFPVRSALLKAWQEVVSRPEMSAVLGDDLRILEILFALDPSYQEICVRLFTRRTKWQRLEKFLSSIKLLLNPADLRETLDHLEGLQYIYTDFETSESLDTILSHLTVPELRQFARRRRIKLIKTGKSELIAALKKFVFEQPSVGPKTTDTVIREAVGQEIGRCMRLDTDMRGALFGLQLLYHCAVPDINSHYDFYTYVGDIDAGRITLPRYQIHDVCAFASSDAFNRYATAMGLFFDYSYLKERRTKSTARGLLEVAEKAFANLKELNDQPPDISSVSRRFTAEHVYAKILTLAATDLTKHAANVKSWLSYLLTHYRGAKRGEWYDRLVMHVLKAGDVAGAGEIISKGLSNPDVAHVDKIALSVRATSLIKRKKLSEDAFPWRVEAPACRDIPKTIIEAKPQKISHVQGRRLQYEQDEAIFTVEEIAMRYYAKHGYPKGVHCEGALLMTLFAALFWDVIYADVPNAHPFVSRLQYIPLDLYSTDFYLRRKALIDTRLEDVACGWSKEMFLHRLEGFFAQHSHEMSVHDVRLSGEVMVEAAACIGRKKLGKMLERLVKDPRQYRAGMPDLFVWDYNSKKCCFVEVKSHHDQLSMKQKLWLEFLKDIEVPVELCLVNSFGEKVPKSRTKQV